MFSYGFGLIFPLSCNAFCFVTLKNLLRLRFFQLLFQKNGLFSLVNFRSHLFFVTLQVHTEQTVYVFFSLQPVMQSFLLFSRSALNCNKKTECEQCGTHSTEGQHTLNKNKRWPRLLHFSSCANLWTTVQVDSWVIKRVKSIVHRDLTFFIDVKHQVKILTFCLKTKVSTNS